ncbi:MAG: hypothetical protein RI933_1014, partial [Actinomycetota bacterium]
MSLEEHANVPTVQLLSPEGEYGVPKQFAEYAQFIEQLTEA